MLTRFEFVAIKSLVSEARVCNFSTSIWVVHEIILSKTLILIWSFLMVSLYFGARQLAILSILCHLLDLLDQVLTLSAPTSQNGQTDSNNSSATADELFECVWPFCGFGA